MFSENLVLKPKRSKGDDGYRVFSVRVPQETVERLDDLSARTNRSRNELINTLLNFAMDRCVVEEERK